MSSFSYQLHISLKGLDMGKFKKSYQSLTSRVKNKSYVRAFLNISFHISWIWQTLSIYSFLLSTSGLRLLRAFNPKFVYSIQDPKTIKQMIKSCNFDLVWWNGYYKPYLTSKLFCLKLVCGINDNFNKFDEDFPTPRASSCFKNHWY